MPVATEDTDASICRTGLVDPFAPTARVFADAPVNTSPAPVAVPIFGVTSVGELEKTRAPEPVSSVMALIKLALEGVAKNVATPDPSPLMPVEIGRPVALVSVTEVGVPRTGVIKA